jgi:hypothetical protein
MSNRLDEVYTNYTHFVLKWAISVGSVNAIQAYFINLYNLEI